MKMSDNFAMRQTRFRDVCGSIDELKRVLYEEPELAAQKPHALESLVDDALYMLGRMEQRLADYERFRSAVCELAAELPLIEGSCRAEALAVAPLLREQLPRGVPLTPELREAAVASAEAIRDVAQDIENKMSRYKTLALALEQAYRAVRGSRSWVLDENEETAPTTQNEPEWARWLPPSPHRERIAHHLQTGRAHILTPDELAGFNDPASVRVGETETPWVQFSDGGVMALPSVRWSDDVRNFYSVDVNDQSPHPNGRHYREYAGRLVRRIDS